MTKDERIILEEERGDFEAFLENAEFFSKEEIEDFQERINKINEQLEIK